MVNSSVAYAKFLRYWLRPATDRWKDPNPPMRIFATAANDIPISDYRDPNQIVIPAGSPVRVLEVTKSGELLITDDLNGERCKLRIGWETKELTDYRESP